MANLNTRIAHALTDHSVDLLRVSAGINRKVKKLLQQLQRELIGELSAVDLTKYQEARLRSLLASVEGLISDSFSSADTLVQDNLERISKIESQAMVSITNSAVGAEIMDVVLPVGTLKQLVTDSLIQGAPNSDWWERQGEDLRFRFAQQMRLGISLGETNAELVGRIRGSNLMNVSASRAEALVRTSVQTVANDARLETFKANDDVISGVQQISTLDNRTSDICIAYDQQAWDLDGNPIGDTDLPFESGPPRHWNCRSVLVPITKTWRDLGIDADEVDPGTRASADGQVAEDTSFGDWFEGKSEAQQDDILGAGKAQLWRDGKISQTDLVDQSGRPMTTEELERKHG